ncbi:Hypothetical protein A7982_10724 [Minicystis rosea]|nr:Hypothetical protein A7982_10724 [Minicystis rosea]
MAARILKPRTSLLTLLGEHRYTQSRLQATPLTAALAVPFRKLRDEWTAVQAKEIALSEAESDARALVDEADERCDDFAARVSKAVLTITKDDRAHPLYVHLFGGKALSVFRRPVLSGQLEAMRAWVDTLSTSPHTLLAAMAPELKDIVAQADKAVALRDEAQQQRRKFRDIGERRQLVDKLNALRKGTHGALAQLAIETPGLPSDFADHFFLVDGSDDEEGPAEPTIESTQQEIAALEAELAAAKAQLAALDQAGAEAAKAAAAKAADEQALAELEKEADALAKKRAALKQKLGQG